MLRSLLLMGILAVVMSGLLFWLREGNLELIDVLTLAALGFVVSWMLLDWWSDTGGYLWYWRIERPGREWARRIRRHGDDV